MNEPNNRIPSSSVTISMLTSESVYKLITAIERIFRWLNRSVIRPYLFLFRCLLG